MADEKYPHGIVCWNELVTRDMSLAEKFYTELLGWKAADSGMPGMKYVVFKAGDKQAGGMMAMPTDVPENVPSHWMTYIAVDDIDAVAEKTKQLGGTVLHGPMDVPTVGRFCIIQDPTGAVVSLITMSE
jgi:predicted enzyme related to lactoylglutathione lyase